MAGMEYSAAGGSYTWMDPLPSKRSKDDKKRRFSEEQIRSLESMFESQEKLEPRQKQQLARDLGLQPRQVAIWFQNKRARWKSKKLEQEYDILRADYDALLSSFESLKKEKPILVKQLQELGSLLQERTRDADSDNGDAGRQGGNKHNLSSQDENDLRFIAGPDDGLNSFSYLSQQESELYPAQPPVSSITSVEQQLCSTSGWLSDESCHNLQWWEFWPLSEYPTLLPEQDSATST